MAILQTVKPSESWIMQVNADYNIMFDMVSVTVAAALPSGTVLKDAATVSVAGDTTVLGILAQDKPAGTTLVRVMTRGNPVLVDGSKLQIAAGAVPSATVQAALEAKQIVFAR